MVQVQARACTGVLAGMWSTADSRRDTWRCEAESHRPGGGCSSAPLLLGHRITECASGWLVGVEPTIDRSQRSALAAWLQPHRSTLRSWYPWQESHLHTLRRCVLGAVCLLFHHRGTDLVKLRGLEPRKVCLKGSALEPLCIQLRMAIVS